MRVRDAQELRALIGLHVEITCSTPDSTSGASGLLIGVTQTVHAVYADFADGISLPIHPTVTVETREPAAHDVALFRSCVAANYYPNLPMTERLTRLVEMVS